MLQLQSRSEKQKIAKKKHYEKIRNLEIPSLLDTQIKILCYYRKGHSVQNTADALDRTKRSIHTSISEIYIRLKIDDGDSTTKLMKAIRVATRYGLLPSEKKDGIPYTKEEQWIISQNKT